MTGFQHKVCWLKQGLPNFHIPISSLLHNGLLFINTMCVLMKPHNTNYHFNHGLLAV